jgi:hypothetical protein
MWNYSPLLTHEGKYDKSDSKMDTSIAFMQEIINLICRKQLKFVKRIFIWNWKKYKFSLKISYVTWDMYVLSSQNEM